jgi:hypothetical protein
MLEWIQETKQAVVPAPTMAMNRAPCKLAPVICKHSRHAGIEHAPRSITRLN